MSKSDQFRQYAEEAMRWVARSETEEEKQLLIELLCTWTAAAVAADASRSQSLSHQNTPAGRPRARISTPRPDFVLVDINMPRMHGSRCRHHETALGR